MSTIPVVSLLVIAARKRDDNNMIVRFCAKVNGTISMDATAVQITFSMARLEINLRTEKIKFVKLNLAPTLIAEALIAEELRRLARKNFNI